MYSPKRRFRLFRTFGPTDAITPSLTTSLSAYTAAATGSWVKITSTEYAALKTNVGGLSVAGATDETITAIGTNTNFTTGSLMFTNIISSTTPKIPANSYVFAVSLYTGAAISTVKVYANNSTSSYTNFTQIGGTLPATSSGALSYYVLKGATTPTATSDGNFAMHSGDNIYHGFKQNVGLPGFGISVSEPRLPPRPYRHPLGPGQPQRGRFRL